MSSCAVRSLLGIQKISMPAVLPVNSVGQNFWKRSSYLMSRSWHNKAAFITISNKNILSGSRVQFCTASVENKQADTAPPPSSESEELKALNDALDQEKKKVAEIQDKYMRALAENQNTLTRMRKQVEDAKLYGIQSLVKDLLEFSDVLHSALENTPKEEVSEKNVHLKNLHVGLTMVEASLQKVFKKYGVQTIDPLGEKFNPNFHEALFQQEVENKEAGTIVAVSKVGFKLSDRVIRPALVGVAK